MTEHRALDLLPQTMEKQVYKGLLSSFYSSDLMINFEFVFSWTADEFPGALSSS